MFVLHGHFLQDMVYQSFEGLPFGEKTIAADYILIQDGTEDFNSPADYNRRTTK